MQCYVFLSSCFELKHSDSQKAHGFDSQANDTMGKINLSLWHESSQFLSVKSARSEPLDWVDGLEAWGEEKEK